MSTPPGPPFRVAYAPGVTPDKWLGRWRERMPRSPLVATLVDEVDQLVVLDDGRAEMSLTRLREGEDVDRDRLHLIPLYEEEPVVVVARDHLVTALDELELADLADEQLLLDGVSAGPLPGWAEARESEPADLPPVTARQAIELAASGAGFVVVPLSVARLHHRRDVVHRPVTGVPGTRVGLAWRRDLDDERVQAFIGIVRGRTARSSR